VSIKESSDELNPDVAVPERVKLDAGPRTATDYLALAIATCGVGYIPLAPGTWGSLVGIAFYFGLASLVASVAETSRIALIAVAVAAIVIVTLIGIWAASRTEKLSGRKDPGKVVVDEVAGQMIALLPISFAFAWPWSPWVIVSFILFRFFDIVKPYPARRLEGLHGGLGIMADDLIAGVYAAVITALFLFVSGRG
jgi:phosphatidylglycerophosphatase A